MRNFALAVLFAVPLLSSHVAAAETDIAGTAIGCYGNVLEFRSPSGVTEVSIAPYVWGWTDRDRCQTKVLASLQRQTGDKGVRILHSSSLHVLYLLDRLTRAEYRKRYPMAPPKCDARFVCFGATDASQLPQTIEEKTLLLPLLLEEGYICAPKDAAPADAGGPPKWAGERAYKTQRGLWAAEPYPSHCRIPKRPPRNSEFIDDKQNPSDDSAIVPTE